MIKRRYLVDTTLRDGEQSPGFAMNKEQKVFIAGLLDDAGVFQIEAGIPAMGSYEKDTVREILANRKKSKIAVWNRMSLSDIKHSLDCEPDIIHFSIPVSYTQIYSKLRKNKTWLLKTAQTCAEYALTKGVEVTIGFEDASRADSAFMISVAELMKSLGIKRLRYADTVGVLTPSRTFSSVAELINHTGMEVEIHNHNDLGMAVANSLAAAKAGALYVDTTIMGIGERSGNCDMQKFLHAAEGHYALDMDRLSALVIEQKVRYILSQNQRSVENED